MEREHLITTRKMNFDDMLDELGEFGRFQITNYALVCLPVLFAAANSLSYVFTAGEPLYRCYIPECESMQNTSLDRHFVKWAIPPDDTDPTKYSTCLRYATNSSTYSYRCEKEAFSKQIISCSEWIFDHEERTIVNDWKLTCSNNEWKLSLIGSSHFAGIVVGSAIFGLLADKYGRKIIFIICTVLMSISGIIQAFSPDYVSFVVLTFINALGTSGVYPLAFIIGVEMVGKRKREVTGIVLNYFYAVGEALVGLIAWWTKDWVAIQLIVAAPPILFAVYYWFIPESVRWLLAHYQNEKAKGIICRAAKVNRVSLSKSLLDSFDESLSIKEREEIVGKRDIWPLVKEMMASRKILIRFIIMYFIWAVNVFVFYGLSLNSTSLGGNKYLNFSMVCLIEIPGYTIAWICIKKIGRKISLVGSLFLCGLTCILTTFISAGMNWVDIILFLLGKLGITSSFGVLYVYTAELLPTAIRSGGVGAASTIARFGALLAPFVKMLPKPYPMVMFGGVAIIAGILAFKLPETLGQRLPETVNEAKKL